MQLSKNSNAHQNKLTNNYVSLRPRQLIETGFLRNEEKVFYMRSFKNNAWKVSSGPVRFTSSKALFTVVIVKAFQYGTITIQLCHIWLLKPSCNFLELFGAKHLFIVFGFVRVWIIHQVCTNLTLSHLVSVVDIMEENTRVGDASVQSICDSLFPASATEHNYFCEFANKIETG